MNTKSKKVKLQMKKFFENHKKSFHFIPLVQSSRNLNIPLQNHEKAEKKNTKPKKKY